MAESIRQTVVKKGIGEAAVRTAEIVSNAKLLIFDPVIGGAAVWAVGKIIRNARGIQEVEAYNPKWGKVRLTLKVKTMPNGFRRIEKITDEVVIKPSRYYKEKQAELERIKKANELIRKRFPREVRGMMRGRYAG